MAEASVISERNRRYHAANRDRLLARQAEQRRSRKAGPDSAQWAVKKLVSDAAPDELRRIADALDRQAASGNLLDGVKHEEFPA